MSNIILIFLCLGLGVILKHSKSFPTNTHVALNQFVIYISLPAMALHYIPNIKLSLDTIFPIAMPWISIGLAFAFFTILGKLFGWSKALIGSLILTAGFGNTSFIGIPIIEALFGKDGLKTVVMIDLPGSFIALSTIGLIIASIYSKGKSEIRDLIKKVFSFPPFLAFLVGMLMNLTSIQFTSQIDETLMTLSKTITPLALVSVGFQLKLNSRSKHWRFLALGLFFKLILLPTIIVFLYKVVFNKVGMDIDVCIIEAAMAPMITASIVATNYGMKPQLNNMMLGIGIPISFITIAIWSLILGII